MTKKKKIWWRKESIGPNCRILKGILVCETQCEHGDFYEIFIDTQQVQVVSYFGLKGKNKLNCEMNIGKHSDIERMIWLKFSANLIKNIDFFSGIDNVNL